MDTLSYQPVRIDLTITLETALHIGTGMGLGQLLDETTVQGPHPLAAGADLPYLPGSSLKGRLRDQTRQLSAMVLDDDERARRAVEASLFGFSDSGGGLVFNDAHLSDEALARELANNRLLQPLLVRGQRSFVSLSPQRRVALEQRLFRLELVEHGLVFASTIHGRLHTPHAERDLALLLLALRALTHLGGHKGRGLGKCHLDIMALTLNGQPRDWRELICTL